jgi:DNA ligase-4
LPQKDEERGAYGIKQNTLGRILIDMVNLHIEQQKDTQMKILLLYYLKLQLAPNDKDSQRLRNYTAPSSTASIDQGDFASVLYSIIKDRSYEGEAVSLTVVNERYIVNSLTIYFYALIRANVLVFRLSELAGLKSSERTKEVKRILLDLFCKMNACQLKWIVRIILKDVKLGVGTDTILGLVSKSEKLIKEVA